METRENEIETKKKISILIIGEDKVGKTSFISKYINNIFPKEKSSDEEIEKLEEKEPETKLFIKDEKKYPISLHEVIYNFNPNSDEFKNCDGIIIMYDITNKESFKDIDELINYCKKTKGEEFPILLLGNKIDEINKRKVNEDDGKKLAKEKRINFKELSCKDGDVDTVVKDLIENILANKQNSCCFSCFH